METVGSSGRLRSFAQNWAIDIESAPRSSKKWLSTGTMSILRTSASTAAMPAAAPFAAGRAVAFAGASAVTSAEIVGCR